MRKIDRYERFHRHIRAWVEQEIDCLVVLGRPGVGKSWAVNNTLGDKPYHSFSARQTPIEAYTRLHDHPTWPVVFDDVSALLHDNNFVDMLKNLCGTGVSTLRWGTTTDRLNGREKHFECASPVLMLLNKIPSKNPDVQAILDRCDSISFEPSKPEVIAYMRENFPDDGDLVDLLAELPLLPSVRTLIKARNWARSKYLDLHEELLAECGVPDPVQFLVDIMQTRPEDAWRGDYVEATGLTERTYRRHKALAAEILTCRIPTMGGHSDTVLRMALPQVRRRTPA